ncbi:glycosyltransferase [Caulobacter sp. AP07]|uniref:glycosyltransferase family 4 protein n=1 Tax=Caulobacter sp. AP07 TaxID=1144304 RepID=UPI0002721B1D|nr:glycosyltransferase family 4 protein [Caulobacter sp. AP07]EJL33376.1 glycosyltransferase [Caulobacter sp. AP07]
MTRVLVFSTLYPNAAQPNHGVFVENRLRATIAQGGIEATVIAPVPYFPLSHKFFGRYSAFARVPRREVRHGVEVWHPRYVAIPKFGSGWAPEALFRRGLALARRLQEAGRRFDVIDAHYFYPDGVAAAHLGQALRLPVIITGRGTDLTLIPEETGPCRRIRWAADQASAMVTVCDDLRRRLIALGAPADRIVVLRNGVDLWLFRPQDRAAARATLGLDGFTLLCVGGLIPRKGLDLVLDALANRPDYTLLIAGGGPLRAALETHARRLGVAGRVRFLGEVAHADLPGVYAAADVLVLASSREGWANVLLEAMACGTPVVATNVNGAGEVIRSGAAGVLMSRRTPECLVEALDLLRQNMPTRLETRRYAEAFGWTRIGEANKALLDGAATAGFEGRHAQGVLDLARYLLEEPEGGDQAAP